MKVFDENCIFDENYHLIFLGDLVDRGVYGFEIVMIIFLLKLLNPRNIHINNGNHEESITNNGGGFRNELKILFGSDEMWMIINDIFKLNHCAILIKNPNLEQRYIYLAHGGFPINKSGRLHGDFNKDYINDNDKIFILNSDINDTPERTGNTIRWNDFHGEKNTTWNLHRGA
jgi:hypothetical protein